MQQVPAFVSNYKIARYGGTIPDERTTFRHSSKLCHPHVVKLVEVVGTAPRPQCCCEIIYRHSWKTNIINILILFLSNNIFICKKHTNETIERKFYYYRVSLYLILELISGHLIQSYQILIIKYFIQNY